jgi:hypothetical protein
MLLILLGSMLYYSIKEQNKLVNEPFLIVSIFVQAIYFVSMLLLAKNFDNIIEGALC